MCLVSRELYNKVVELVMAEFELKEEEVLKGNNEDCRMARKVLITVLAERLTDSEIAKLTRLKQCTISSTKCKCTQCKQNWSCERTKQKINQILKEVK